MLLTKIPTVHQWDTNLTVFLTKYGVLRNGSERREVIFPNSKALTKSWGYSVFEIPVLQHMCRFSKASSQTYWTTIELFFSSPSTYLLAPSEISKHTTLSHIFLVYNPLHHGPPVSNMCLLLIIVLGTGKVILGQQEQHNKATCYTLCAKGFGHLGHKTDFLYVLK